MSDPYEILGVSRNATDDEVKTAYRNLARKYHPDIYAGNPLEDVAAEKMKEINAAYDQVMTQRKQAANSGSAGDYARYSTASQQNAAGESQFSYIRRLVNMRRISEAEELLDGVPPHSRDAEWHFLKGVVQHSRGWLDDAYNNFVRAAQLDPNNIEYRTALNQLQWQRKTGRAPGSGYHTNTTFSNCSVCDICAAMYCADCCCECMGGNLCRCC